MKKFFVTTIVLSALIAGNLYAGPPSFTGDGGKGKSITILPPRAAGLTAGQDYIPALVQGEFISNFSDYSALSVFNRQQLEAQYKELESSYYDLNAGADIGKLPPTDYFMSGNITKTSTGYSLQISIARNDNKMVAASYSGTCTFAELDNLTAVRKASADLLAKLNVSLTDTAKQKLAAAPNAAAVNAQTALAQGITAQQKGTTIEALSYYYQAAAFDPSLLEAANRASVMTASIASGNIGANVRNDIQRRNEWLKILTEAADYFRQHPPFKIVYDPALRQGKIDYAFKTVNLSFSIMVIPVAADFEVLDSLARGLNKTGKREEWGLEYWPFDRNYRRQYSEGTEWRGPLDPTAVFKLERPYDHLQSFTVTATLKNDTGKTIGTANRKLGVQVIWWDDLKYFMSGSSARVQKILGSTITFQGVKADDITDKLSVSVTTDSGNINVSTSEIR
jgi:hypothetical protein